MGAEDSVPPLAGRRILAVRSGALGDTLLCLPALAALRAAAGPEGWVELLGRSPAGELARGGRLANRVHPIDRGPFRAFYGRETAQEEALLSFLSAFDLVVAWSRLPRLGALLEALGHPGLEIDPLPPAGVHVSDHLLESLTPLGARATSVPPELELSDEARREARRLLDRDGLSPRRFVAIHPGSGNPGKNWPAERYAAIADLADADGVGVLWVEGEADRETVAHARAHRKSPVARNLPLDVLAALLAESGTFLGNDSGVSHLAAAAGAPTLAVFGPTDPALWAPRGRSVTVVEWHRSPSVLWDFARGCIDRY